MSDRTNVEAATEAVMDDWPTTERARKFVRTVLDACDERKRLADLTPDDTTAILDYLLWQITKQQPGVARAAPPIPAHVWEVLSR